ncbi:MAG: patatin-like phospholipase family protein, partial [Thermoanaerobaculales bacterium]|nr:patatin-like phospholipase family protein [Thermoanaerobaculales bacterium]
MISDRMSGPGPKRILALDGGGIRGALTIGYLIRLEEILQARHHDPDLRLRDYFDLIGGASTGSIIAAGLAGGMSAREVAEHYRVLGPRVFGTKRRITGRLQSLFDGNKLVEVLAEQLGDRTLGDDSITTGLCIITKRADTRSTWPLLNHPSGKFYEANRDIPLTTAIRASTAAPFFFAPEGINVEAGGGLGAFVDGAVSMANNPSLLLFLIATLQGFPFHWATGRDDLLIVSIGTGKWSKGSPAETVLNHRLWNWAMEVPTMLMEDASNQADLLLRVLGWTPTPVEIDREM